MDTINDLRESVDPDKRKSRSFKEYAEIASRAGLPVLGGVVGFSGNIMDPNLTAHQLANACMVQLFDASQLAPGDMKTKVLAFQEEVRTFLVHYIKESARLEQRRIGLVLEASGHSSAAALAKLDF
jgi:DNA-directed RNA polymerase subunit E'/Rpb7